MTITVAIDGSALGNPGPAGWAWVVDENRWDSGGWPEATNNVGELSALLELLVATREAGLEEQPLHILADSQYVINCVTKWLPGWKRRGWKKADGKPVANQKILEKIDTELQGRNYRFEWVRGHAGHRLNELADDRAREAALSYQRGSPGSGGPGFRGETAVPVKPADVVSDQQLLQNWAEISQAATVRPVTVRLENGGELMLLDAAEAKAALASHRNEAAPPTLF